MRSIAACLFLQVLPLCLCLAQDEKPVGPERWEKDIAKFEAADAENSPPKNALLFTGSSSTRLWDLEKSFPDRVTINRGFGGSTLADAIHYFDRIIAAYQPKAILIYAGDNDVSKGLDADGVFADYQKLVALVDEKLPGTPLIYIAIKPSIKRWELWPTMNAANEKIAAFCEKTDGCYFADIGKPMLAIRDGKPDPRFFKDDGLHVNEAGYAAWKAVIDPVLKEALNR